MNKIKLMILFIPMISYNPYITPAAPAASTPPVSVGSAAAAPSSAAPAGAAAETPESLTSRLLGFFKNISKKTSEMIFSKKPENEYWEIFKIEDVLKRFQRQATLNDQDECSTILLNLINQTKENHKAAQALLFHKYYLLDKKIMGTIEKELTGKTKLLALPSSPGILITTLDTIEGDISDAVIPSPDYSEYNPDLVKKIESIFLLNLNITFLDQGDLFQGNFIARYFDVIALQTIKKYTDAEILKITEKLQKDINGLYKKDKAILLERRNTLLHFIIQKFIAQTPEIDNILYAIDDPKDSRILFTKDTATDKLQKINEYKEIYKSK
jgi:hypothetical protein